MKVHKTKLQREQDAWAKAVGCCLCVAVITPTEKVLSLREKLPKEGYVCVQQV